MRAVSKQDEKLPRCSIRNLSRLPISAGSSGYLNLLSDIRLLISVTCYRQTCPSAIDFPTLFHNHILFRIRNNLVICYS